MANEDIDVGVARRQAFGTRFERTEQDKADVARLKDGTLSLPPHKNWKLPDDINWYADPFKDRNWQFQLHALRWLDPLRREAGNGDREAAELWLKVAKDWAEKNADFTQPTPDFAWIDMADGQRALVLVFAAPMIEQYFPDQLPWLAQTVRTHVEWLLNPEVHASANHALHQAVGLFVASSFLKDREAQEKSLQWLDELFHIAYDDEGVNAEGAISYHRQNYDWWRETQRRLELEGVDLPGGMGVLGLVPEELAHATRPTNRFTAIGDTDGGNPRMIDHPHTQYVSTNGEDGYPPSDTVKLYSRGYLFARSGWGDAERDLRDQTFCALTFGEQTKAHGHEDGSAVSFTANGEDWLTDPGRYHYNWSKFRAHIRSHEAHNVVSVPSVPYDREKPTDLVHFDDGADYVDVSVNVRGYEPVRSTRRVVYSKAGEYLVVIDTVEASEPVEAQQAWQCERGVDVEESDGNFTLSKNESATNLIAVLKPDKFAVEKGQESPFSGWVSSGWKKKTAANRIRLVFKGKQIRFVTVIVPSEVGRPASARMVYEGDEIVIDVRSKYGEEQIRIGDTVSVRPFGTKLQPGEAVRMAARRATQRAGSLARSGGRRLANGLRRTPLRTPLRKTRAILRRARSRFGKR